MKGVKLDVVIAAPLRSMASLVAFGIFASARRVSFCLASIYHCNRPSSTSAPG